MIESELHLLHFDEGKTLRTMYCAVSVHIKESQVVEISGALHHGVSHNHIGVLGCKTLEINQIDHCLKDY